MNAVTANSVVIGIAHTTVIARLQVISGAYNLFSAPALVDVSAMEFSIAWMWAADGTRGKGGSGNASYGISLVDGGPTGDATGRSALFAALSGSLGTNLTQFASTIPFDVAGTSTTDLAADDWVNYLELTSTTGNEAAGVVTITSAFLHGKPSGIS